MPSPLFLDQDPQEGATLAMICLAMEQVALTPLLILVLMVPLAIIQLATTPRLGYVDTVELDFVAYTFGGQTTLLVPQASYQGSRLLVLHIQIQPQSLHSLTIGND